MEKIFAYVGKWEHDLGTEKLGFDIFEHNKQNGTISLVGSSDISDIMVGAVYLDQKRGILYCTDENENLPGITGGGGRVLAFALNRESGAMKFLNASPSYGVRASSLITDQEGNYLIVTNHAGRKPITKTVRDCFGKIQLLTEYDEANTVLFRLNDDGSIGEAVDVFRHTITGALPTQNNPHPHQVTVSPDGSLFAVCDKGGDAIYVFRLDYEHDRLILTGDAPYRDLPGSSPRYGVFHPNAPYYFMNHETKPIVHAFRYGENGVLKLVDTQDVLPEGFVMPEGIPANRIAESSDLRIHPNGKWLYNIIRGLDIVTVFAVNEGSGLLTKCQTIKLVGEGEKAGARGCAISPDGQYLYVALLGCKRIVVLSIGEDGLLSEPKTVYDGIYNPANITYWET